jgi:hypothetical protein
MHDLLRLSLLCCSFGYFLLLLDGNMAHPGGMAFVLTAKQAKDSSWLISESCNTQFVEIILKEKNYFLYLYVCVVSIYHHMWTPY